VLLVERKIGPRVFAFRFRIDGCHAQFVAEIILFEH